MTLRSLGLAGAAGIAAFLVVGVAVTELASNWIEFSLFVGLPAGALAGVGAAAAVYLGLGAETPARRRRVALAAGGFGVAFLLVLVVTAGVANVGTVVSLLLASVVGLLVALVAFFRPPGKTPALA